MIGNLLNLSFLSARIPGPEALLAGRPLLLVSVAFVPIVVTLWLFYMMVNDVTFERLESAGPAARGRTTESRC